MTGIRLTHAHVIAFRMLRDAAAAGLRCPIADEIARALKIAGVGGAATNIVPELCRLGYITSRVYSKNWRIVEIEVGPCAGKKTLSPPFHCGPPYKVVGKDPHVERPQSEPTMPTGAPPARRIRGGNPEYRNHSKPKAEPRAAAAALPVRDGEFVKAPTREQLMGKR
jgi:hypothetical protein